MGSNHERLPPQPPPAAPHRPLIPKVRQPQPPPAAPPPPPLQPTPRPLPSPLRAGTPYEFANPGAEATLGGQCSSQGLQAVIVALCRWLPTQWAGSAAATAAPVAAAAPAAATLHLPPQLLLPPPPPPPPATRRCCCCCRCRDACMPRCTSASSCCAASTDVFVFFFCCCRRRRCRWGCFLGSSRDATQFPGVWTNIAQLRPWIDETKKQLLDFSATGRGDVNTPSSKFKEFGKVTFRMKVVMNVRSRNLTLAGGPRAHRRGWAEGGTAGLLCSCALQPAPPSQPASQPASQRVSLPYFGATVNSREQAEVGGCRGMHCSGAGGACPRTMLPTPLFCSLLGPLGGGFDGKAFRIPRQAGLENEGEQAGVCVWGWVGGWVVCVCGVGGWCVCVGGGGGGAIASPPARPGARLPGHLPACLPASWRHPASTHPVQHFCMTGRPKGPAHRAHPSLPPPLPCTTDPNLPQIQSHRDDQGSHRATVGRTARSGGRPAVDRSANFDRVPPHECWPAALAGGAGRQCPAPRPSSPPRLLPCAHGYNDIDLRALGCGRPERCRTLLHT